MGYDDTIPTPEGYGAFKIVNSYGADWGQNGYTYMTYNAVASAMRSGFVYTDLVNGQIVDYMEEVTPSLVGADVVKFDWKDTINAAGYKVLNENFRVIANVYESEYTENIAGKTRVKRYFQAFNSISTSNVVSAEVDLNDAKIETIPLEINDTVSFHMNFSGSGRYDIKIKDVLDTLIKTELNLLGKSGLNIYTWDGKNNQGNIVDSGNYKLELIPYSGTTPKEAVILDFVKEEKISSASAKKYSLNGKIYKVEITLTASKPGVVTLTSGENEVLRANVTAGQTATYELNPTDINGDIVINIRNQ